jgi:GDP-L-fucose synthase
MIGAAVRKLLPDAEYITRHQLHTSEYDIQAKTMIHLAAKVGGVQANMNEMSDFYTENSLINQRILKHAHANGAHKVVSLLSTCIYPDAPYVTYPLTEEQLHLGPPHVSNYGYAYAKRMVDVMSRAYRQQYGCNFITAIPNNLYGENDNFHLEDSHVIPALMRKIWEAKINNIDHVECWGDGSPLREFTYSEDLAKILLFLVDKYSEPEPINIGSTAEYSIKDLVTILCEILEYKGSIVWDVTKPAGQYRKPTCNNKLIDLGWKTEWYTSLEEGLKKTCKWFTMNYPNVRGV